MYKTLDKPKIKCKQPGCYFDTEVDKRLLRHYYYSHPSIIDVKSYLINSNKSINDSHILYGVKKLLDFKEELN